MDDIYIGPNVPNDRINAIVHSNEFKNEKIFAIVAGNIAEDIDKLLINTKISTNCDTGFLEINNLIITKNGVFLVKFSKNLLYHIPYEILINVSIVRGSYRLNSYLRLMSHTEKSFLVVWGDYRYAIKSLKLSNPYINFRQSIRQGIIT